MKLFDLIEQENLFQLVKTHYIDRGEVIEFSKPQILKEWEQKPNPMEVINEIELNDWNRWKHALFKGQKVEVSEFIYDDMLNCLPPRNRKGNYFEVGEPHHHDTQGKPVHRAFWMEDGKYYTGYPR